MNLQKGQRVRTPHPTMMGAGTAEGIYVGPAPDHVVGTMMDGYTERIKQATLRYDDGSQKTWPLDAVEPVEKAR